MKKNFQNQKPFPSRIIPNIHRNLVSTSVGSKFDYYSKLDWKKIKGIVGKRFTNMDEVFEQIQENYKLIEDANYTNELLFLLISERIMRKYAGNFTLDIFVRFREDLLHIERGSKLAHGKYMPLKLEFYPPTNDKATKDKLWRVEFKSNIKSFKYIIRTDKKRDAVQKAIFSLKYDFPAQWAKRHEEKFIITDILCEQIEDGGKLRNFIKV